MGVARAARRLRRVVDPRSRLLQDREIAGETRQNQANLDRIEACFRGIDVAKQVS